MTSTGLSHGSAETSSSPACVVGRLAPSPTGALHLGNARSFLLAWLDARQAGGRLVLRIEDLDSPRVKPGAIEQALDDLRWLGLDWDGPPIIQTTRMAEHIAALEALRAADLIYPCACSRTDILRAGSAPHVGEEGPRYPGFCRAKAPPAAGTPVAWRLRCPPGVIRFVDAFAGPRVVDVGEQAGDFVVARRSETFLPAYQLAVVLDDARDGVTRVVRGDDLLDSTGRQILVARALRQVGYTIPTFAYCHVPLVLGPDGRRLAKRHGDSRLAHYRALGVPAGRVLALLAEWIGVGRRADWAGFSAGAILAALRTSFRWDRLRHLPLVCHAEDDAWLRRGATGGSA